MIQNPVTYKDFFLQCSSFFFQLLQKKPPTKMPLEGQKIYLHQNKKVNETPICIEHKEACWTMQTNLPTTNMQKAMYSKYLFIIENQTLNANSTQYPRNPSVNISGSHGRGPKGAAVGVLDKELCDW